MRVAVIIGPVIPEQLALWRAIGESGIDITLIGTESPRYGGRLPGRPRRPTGLDSVLLPLMTPAPKRGQVWWLYRGLGPALQSHRPDLVHVLSEPWGGLVLQALQARRRLGRGVPFTVHGADNIYSHGGRAERLVREAILSHVWRHIDGFLSWSEGGIEAARRAGLRDIPTAVVPAIVPDPADFPSEHPRTGEYRSRFGLPPDEPIVGYVGRLHREKGVLDLLEAMRSLGRRAPFLSVWGAGPLEASFRQALASGDVRGRFGGGLMPDEVPQALQSCDVIVVPSRTTVEWKEQFGRIIIEAMLARSAVVAYRSGAIPEVVGEGGLLLGEGDIQGLASAIARLAADEVERSEVAARGRKRALERFHPAKLARRLSAFWWEIGERR